SINLGVRVESSSWGLLGIWVSSGSTCLSPPEIFSGAGCVWISVARGGTLGGLWDALRCVSFGVGFELFCCDDSSGERSFSFTTSTGASLGVVCVWLSWYLAGSSLLFWCSVVC